MSNKKDVDLSEYGISQNRYRELKYFCLQYPEWKKELESLSFIQSVKYNNVGSAGNKKSTPTENIALKKMELEAKCKLLDEVIEIALKGMEYLEKSFRDNIIKGKSFEYIDVPCSRSTFYRARRNFFAALSKRLNEQH